MTAKHPGIECMLYSLLTNGQLALALNWDVILYNILFYWVVTLLVVGGPIFVSIADVHFFPVTVSCLEFIYSLYTLAIAVWDKILEHLPPQGKDVPIFVAPPFCE